MVRRVPAVTTIATMGGLALAPLLRGVLAQYAPHPTKLVYVVYIVLLLVAACGVPCPGDRALPPIGRRSAFAGLGVPATLRSNLLSAGVTAFCLFTLLGLFAALAPSFLIGTLHQSSAAVSGLVVFLIFAMTCVAEVLFRGLAYRTAVAAGFVLLVIGLWVIVVGLSGASLTVFIIGTLVEDSALAWCMAPASPGPTKLRSPSAAVKSSRPTSWPPTSTHHSASPWPRSTLATSAPPSSAPP